MLSVMIFIDYPLKWTIVFKSPVYFNKGNNIKYWREKYNI